MRFVIIAFLLLFLLPAAPAQADCVNPAAAPGKILYNANHEIMQFCAGSTWARFPKRSGQSCATLGSWAQHAVTTGDGWRSVAFGNNTFVAVRGSGTGSDVMTSADGVTWQPQTQAVATFAITYGGSYFLAIEAGGTRRTVIRSPDGVSWSTHNNAMPSGGDWWAVVHGHAGYVAVDHDSASGRVAHSPDGITWLPYATGGTAGRMRAIAYGNGRYVGIKESGHVMVSTDGMNWNEYAPGYPLSEDIAFGNGRFVTGQGISSTDGVTWTPGTGTSHGFNNIAYGDGRFVGLVGDPWSGSFHIYTSSDGMAWSGQAVDGPGWYYPNAIAFGNGAFVAVNESNTQPAVMRAECFAMGCSLGDWAQRETHNISAIASGNGMLLAFLSGWPSSTVYTSADGLSWTPQSMLPAQSAWTDAIYAGGQFVALGRSSSVIAIATSPDGINWTPRTPAAVEDWRAITYGNGRYVAVGFTGTHRVMSSTDGVVWAPHTAAAAYWWNGVAYGNGRFVAVAEETSTNNIMTSTDGMNWVMANPTAVTTTLRDVVFAGGQFVAVSDGDNRVVRSADGVTWTVHSVPPGNWHKIAYGAGRYMAVSWDGPNKAITSTDGITWTPMSVPGNANLINVAYANGVFAGGENGIYATTCNSMTQSCSEAGKLVFNEDHRLLQWCDGTNWHAAGPGNASGPNAGCNTPNATAGALVFNEQCANLQYCDGDNWRKIGPVDPCACGTPTTPGLVCGNGTVFAGNSPDGNVPMFVTPTDAGVMPYNNGNYTGLVGQVVDNYATGAANTLTLVQTDSDSATPGDQPHRAALYCYCLGKDPSGYCAGDPTAGANGYGKDDWYLPSIDELLVVCNNRTSIGGFNLTGTAGVGGYRASLDDGGDQDADWLLFSGCDWNSGMSKPFDINVRCVRKGN